MKAESVVRRVRTHQTRSGTVPKGSILHARPPDLPAALCGAFRAGNIDGELCMRCFPARGPDTAAYAPGLKRIWCRPAGRRLRTERCRERMRPVRRRRRFPGRTLLPGPAGDSAGTDDLRPDCRRVKRLPRRNQGRQDEFSGLLFLVPAEEAWAERAFGGREYRCIVRAGGAVYDRKAEVRFAGAGTTVAGRLSGFVKPGGRRSRLDSLAPDGRLLRLGAAPDAGITEPYGRVSRAGAARRGMRRTVCGRNIR